MSELLDLVLQALGRSYRSATIRGRRPSTTR